MRKGFTLIELLAVIAILAIILVIAVPQILGVIEQSKKDTLNVDAGNIAKAIEIKRVNESVNVETLTIDNLTDFGIDKTKYDGFGATLINNKVVVTVTKDGNVGENTFDSKVYGVSWNGTGSTLTRTNDSTSFTYTRNASTITSSFDTAEIYSEMTEVTDTYGNVFIKIPKFYIKKTTDGTNWTWQISKSKKDNDYYLPSCFYNEQSKKILPYVLVSKYNASLSTDTTKLESKTGKVPLVSRTISQFRTLARANNSGTNQGYQLLDIHVVDVLQTLFYVEFATLDSQSIMYGYTYGQYNLAHIINSISGTTLTLPSGVASNYRVGQMIDIGTTVGGRNIATNLKITTVSGDTITYENVSGISTIPGTIATGQIVYNIGYLTGTTDSVNTSSGSPISNTDGKYSMKYRGIENIYGNIWQIIDGLNIQDYQAYVAKDPNQYVSDVYSGAYTKIGYINANTDNLISKMGYDSNNPYIQLPIEVNGSNMTYKDYYYRNTGNRIALLGGRWSDGPSAGVSYWSLIQVSSVSHLIIGSRFLKIPL